MTDTPTTPTSSPTSTAPAIENRNQAADGLGLIGLLLSILGLVTCGFWLFSIPGLIVSIVATQRGSSGKATAGVILGAIGVVMFLIIPPLLLGLTLPALAKARATAREVQTTSQLQQIHAAMPQSGQPFLHPTDSDGNPVTTVSPETHPALPHHTDPWGNPYRIDAGPDGKTDPVVKSDGPDQTPGTEDDLRHPPE